MFRGCSRPKNDTALLQAYRQPYVKNHAFPCLPDKSGFASGWFCTGMSPVSVQGKDRNTHGSSKIEGAGTYLQPSLLAPCLGSEHSHIGMGTGYPVTSKIVVMSMICQRASGD